MIYQSSMQTMSADGWRIRDELYYDFWLPYQLAAKCVAICIQDGEACGYACEELQEERPISEIFSPQNEEVLLDMLASLTSAKRQDSVTVYPDR